MKSYNKKFRAAIIITAVLSLGFTSTVMAAGSVNTPMTVTTTVSTACTIGANPSLTFPAYNPLSGSGVTGSGNLSIACNKSTVPSIWLSKTAGDMAGTGGNTDKVAYLLFIPSTNNPATAACGATGTPWPTVTGSAYALTAATNTTARTYPICGSIAGGQNVAADTYSDTLTVNVNF